MKTFFLCLVTVRKPFEKKTKQKILLANIICISIHKESSYLKEINLANQEKISIKYTWSEIYDLLEMFKEDYFITNSKEHLIFKNHIIRQKNS